MALDQTFAPVEGGELMLWIQPDGANTSIYPLGCHGIEDIEEVFGAIEQLLCRDLSQPNKWRTVKLSQGTPELIETSIVGDLLCQVADWLELVTCEFSLYLNIVCCGRLDIFDNFERSFVMETVRKSANSLTGLNSRTEQTRVEQSFAISIAPPLVRAYLLQPTPLTIATTNIVTDLSFLRDEQCVSSCGLSRTNCQIGFVATGDNEVYATTNSGNTLTKTLVNPLGAGEAIASIETFIVGRDTIRTIVVRGTTDALNPAEIAFTDDNGATPWSTVDVGATVGQFATNSGAMFALDRFNIWLAMTGGYIYKSNDAGQTWVTQEAGVLTADNLNAIHFYNSQSGYAVGDTDVILRTRNGGDAWFAVSPTGTGDAITAVCSTGTMVWVGTEAGELYYSDDEGVTWNQRTITVGIGGVVTKIRFTSSHIGYLSHTDGATTGTIHQTINGGVTWSPIPVPDNLGYNTVEGCAANLVFYGGGVYAGNGTVVRSDVVVNSNPPR